MRVLTLCLGLALLLQPRRPQGPGRHPGRRARPGGCMHADWLHRPALLGLL